MTGKKGEKNMKLYVIVYDKCKYEKDSKEIWEGKYTDVEKFEVKEISQDEILKETDGSCVDDYNEYLILYLGNGETATFRNSYVDIFMIGR